jgi:hypothetical protein
MHAQHNMAQADSSPLSAHPALCIDERTPPPPLLECCSSMSNCSEEMHDTSAHHLQRMTLAAREQHSHDPHDAITDNAQHAWGGGSCGCCLVPPLVQPSPQHVLRP